MAAPDMTQRMTVFVQKTGTDDAGYNIVGAPYSRLTIAAALADLADTTRYPAASSTFFHIVAVGPGTFTEAGIALPPWTFIVGSCDGEDQPTTIILTSADINLTSAWNANATARGGFANCTVRAASGTPALDMTMPVPSAGNPTRTVEFQNFHHNLTSQIFEATGTADNFVAQLFRQFGTNTDTIRFTSGTTRINNFWSAASITCVDKASFAASGNWEGVVISNASATLTVNSIAAAGNTLRMQNGSVRSLILAQTAPGVLAVSADTSSLPVRASVSVTGTATLAANLTILNDAAGVAYSPTTPGNWAFAGSTPTTVQQALDSLAAFAGGGGTGTFVRIIRTGNNSLAAWGTAGAAINDTANTFTDTTSAGAVAGVTAARSFGIPTFASAGGVTYADAANVYIAGAPAITGGAATNTWSLYIAAGDSRITTGALFFGAATPASISGAAGVLTLATVSTGFVSAGRGTSLVKFGGTYNGNNGWGGARPAFVLDDGTVRGSFQTTGTGTVFGSETAHGFDIFTNNTQRLAVTSAGQFTFNTLSSGNNPIATFGSGSVNIQIGNKFDGSGWTGARPAVYLTDGTVTGMEQITGSVYNIASISAHPLTFGTTNTEAMRLTTTRNLLVGTTTDVTGNGQISAAGFWVGATAGIDAAITTAALVGKTITVSKGVITGFA